ncbi:MAG: VCBS repeat-containing protein [Pirellulales bacterium]|nr:VCBS repeat-containing protein [Pirellulales bacterium]
MRRRNYTVAGITLLPLVLIPGLTAAGGDETKTTRFTEHLIKDGYTYSFGIAAADLNGDGHIDLTSADALPHNRLYWFENDGKGNFRQHLIEKDYPERLERHAIGDVNGDGKPDVVIIENLRGDVLWYRNSGHPAKEDGWERLTITKGTIPGAYDVALADLDGDGLLDVAASTWTLSNKFVWFQNPGDPEKNQPWKMRVIEENMAETRTIRAGDFNGDGKPDLLGTAVAAGQVVWYENPGKAEQPWKKHVIDAKSPQPIHGHPVDMDRDGDLDVVMALGMSAAPGTPETRQVAWYENVGKLGDGTQWKKHIIADNLDHAFEAVAGDLNGDGHVDVAATTWAADSRVVWFENLGDPCRNWKMHELKKNWCRANQIIIADFNGDQRPDLAAGAERGANEVRWWRNEGSP